MVAALPALWALAELGARRRRQPRRPLHLRALRGASAHAADDRRPRGRAPTKAMSAQPSRSRIERLLALWAEQLRREHPGAVVTVRKVDRDTLDESPAAGRDDDRSDDGADGVDES